MLDLLRRFSSIARPAGSPSKQSESDQVVLVPSRMLEKRTQRPWFEGVAGRMKGDDDPAPVRMAIYAVTP